VKVGIEGAGIGLLSGPYNIIALLLCRDTLGYGCVDVLIVDGLVAEAAVVVVFHCSMDKLHPYSASRT